MFQCFVHSVHGVRLEWITAAFLQKVLLCFLLTEQMSLSHLHWGIARAASSTSNIVKWNYLPWGNENSHQVPLRSLWPAEIYNDHHLNTNMYFCVTLHFDQLPMFQSKIQHIKYYNYINTCYMFCWACKQKLLRMQCNALTVRMSHLKFLKIICRLKTKHKSWALVFESTCSGSVSTCTLLQPKVLDASQQYLHQHSCEQKR
jgi:hypothetical protein